MAISTELRYPLAPLSSEMRRMPVGNYLVFYSVRAGAVEIVRVTQSARDFRDMPH